MNKKFAAFLYGVALVIGGIGLYYREADCFVALIIFVIALLVDFGDDL